MTAVNGEMRSWVLRLFAGSWSALFALGAWFVWSWLPGALWLLPLAVALFFAFGLLRPEAMRRPYRLVERLLTPVGRFFALILMALVYFGVFTPYALVLRLVGWNPLRLHRSRWGASAWVEPATPEGGDDCRWQY